jgi:hypothetical protein
MTDDRDAERAARRAETEAMVEAEAAKAKEVLTKRAEQKAQAVTTEAIMRLIVAQVNGLVEKTAEELAHSKGADAVRWRTEIYREIAANIAPLIKSGS